MVNKYCVKANEIWIEAPGSARMNKIKNDLIWDLNEFLSNMFELYAVFLSKKPVALALSKRVSVFPKKYVAFRELDDMFVKRTVLSNEEIDRYRKTMDPLNRMDDAVFNELCCMENVDIEYVAVENANQLFNKDMADVSLRQIHGYIVTRFPIYVSLFGFKEMKIVINRKELLKPIIAIVSKHCDDSCIDY